MGDPGRCSLFLFAHTVLSTDRRPSLNSSKQGRCRRGKLAADIECVGDFTLGVSINGQVSAEGVASGTIRYDVWETGGEDGWQLTEATAPLTGSLHGKGCGSSHATPAPA